MGMNIQTVTLDCEKCGTPYKPMAGRLNDCCEACNAGRPQVLTAKQRDKLHRYDESIRIQKRTLATLHEIELVVDNGETIKRTEKNLAAFQISRDAYAERIIRQRRPRIARAAGW